MKKQFILTVLATFTLLFVGFFANAQSDFTTLTEGGSVPAVDSLARIASAAAADGTTQGMGGTTLIDPSDGDDAEEETGSWTWINALKALGYVIAGIVILIALIILISLFAEWRKRVNVKALSGERIDYKTATVAELKKHSRRLTLGLVEADRKIGSYKRFKRRMKAKEGLGWKLLFMLLGFVEHYLSHGLGFLFRMNNELRKLESIEDTEERYKKARHLLKEYIMSLATVSITIIVLVFGPSLIGAARKLSEFIPFYVPFDGVQLNVAVLACYVLTVILIICWGLVLCFRWRSPSPGHITWVRINNHFGFPKAASSASILTIPKLITFWECPTLIGVGCILSESEESGPAIQTHIITAPEETKNQLIMNRADFHVIVEIGGNDEENGKKFFNKYGNDVKRFEKDLMCICASSREQVCGLKQGLQIPGSLGEVRSRIKQIINIELSNLDCGYKVASFLMGGLGFSHEIKRDDSGIVLVDLAIPDTIPVPAG